jgi:hypothetical protein
MAPELFEESYNEKVDIFAFGMCVLEMVTNEYPYVECQNIVGNIIRKGVTGELPESVKKMTSRGLRELCTLCLTPIEQRPSALELLTNPLLAKEYEDEVLVYEEPLEVSSASTKTTTTAAVAATAAAAKKGGEAAATAAAALGVPSTATAAAGSLQTAEGGGDGGDGDGAARDNDINGVAGPVDDDDVDDDVLNVSDAAVGTYLTIKAGDKGQETPAVVTERKPNSTTTTTVGGVSAKVTTMAIQTTNPATGKLDVSDALKAKKLQAGAAQTTLLGGKMDGGIGSSIGGAKTLGDSLGGTATAVGGTTVVTNGGVGSRVVGGATVVGGVGGATVVGGGSTTGGGKLAMAMKSTIVGDLSALAAAGVGISGIGGTTVAGGGTLQAVGGVPSGTTVVNPAALITTPRAADQNSKRGAFGFDSMAGMGVNVNATAQGSMPGLGRSKSSADGGKGNGDVNSEEAKAAAATQAAAQAAATVDQVGVNQRSVRSIITCACSQVLTLLFHSFFLLLYQAVAKAEFCPPFPLRIAVTVTDEQVSSLF